jgi:hypothetical protein
MRLSSVFKRLVSGEFHRHSLGEGLVDGSLNPDHYEIVLPMLNMGIDALHTRFVLREDQVIINLIDHITRYKLHTDHATYNNTDITGLKPKYLHDSQYYPFYNTVIKILSIHNELGQERFINDENQNYSIHLNNYNTFQHPFPDDDNAVSVIYQATLPDIELTPTFNPDSIEVDMSIPFIEALCYFVGGRIHIGMNDQETLSESNNFIQKYERALQVLSKDNINRSDVYTSDQFQLKGWV